jgi:hypothetical protein
VWCGVVWCGAVSCGAVRCRAVWCGVVSCRAVRCGAVWCGVVWCGDRPHIFGEVDGVARLSAWVQGFGNFTGLQALQHSHPAVTIKA